MGAGLAILDPRFAAQIAGGLSVRWRTWHQHLILVDGILATLVCKGGVVESNKQSGTGLLTPHRRFELTFQP
jgi:hypothetical protein